MTAIGCILVLGSVLAAYIRSRQPDSFPSFDIPAVHCVQAESKNIYNSHVFAFRVLALVVSIIFTALTIASELFQARAEVGFLIYTIIGGFIQVGYFFLGNVLSARAMDELPSHAGLRTIEKTFVVLAHYAIPYTFAMMITSWGAVSADYRVVNDTVQVAVALEHVVQMVTLIFDVLVCSQIPHDSDHATHLGLIPALLVLIQAIVHLVRDANSLPACGAPLLSGPDSPYYLAWICLFIALHYLGFLLIKILVHLRKPLFVGEKRISTESVTTARL